MTTLQGRAVTRRFGGLTAVDAVDVEVAGGEVVALIGPNGAGKSTLFACLSGAERPDAGQVLLDGVDVTRQGPDAMARRGVARTFQRLAVFGTLSVRENLLVGAESRRPGRLLRGLLGRPDRHLERDLRRVEQVTEALRLGPVLDQPAGALPTGTQRMVELGRALCGEPSVLLLDEPASGLDSVETAELQAVLRSVADTGTAVLLVEHDVDLVLRTADRVYAMAAGRLLAAGPPEDVRRDPTVREAYLGSPA